ncbi:putative AAA+ ATPase domain-containing protein [Seiridium unicorne]|uniref:AAA+ ATPase domain-containing protein n=1 Tax=Seiridium unicorne TaxID=138068 RepID=A0ABR2V9L6_9PEZI
MLGLRKIPGGLRKHASRPFSSSKKSTESLSSDSGMAVSTDGVQASHNVQATKDVVEATVTEVAISDSGSVKSGQHVDALTMLGLVIPSPRLTRVVRVYQDACVCRQRMIDEVEELDDVYFDNINLQTYLAYIANERLIHMPKRGSSWDRVLREAEYFGLQIVEFAFTVGEFIDESIAVRNTALAGCRALLELGHEQAQALEPTFTVLYEIGHLLGHLIRLRDLLTLNEVTTYALGDLFSSLVSLIGTVVVVYRQRISRISGNSVAINFDEEFGGLVKDILTRRTLLFEHIWNYSLSSEHASASLQPIYRQLGSPRSSSTSLVYGRAARNNDRVPGTCDWIERDLIDFFERDKNTLSITGGAGHGKSTLSTWIKERLERPIGHVRQERLKFETISFSFECENAMESTTLDFLKGVLVQLLDLNVGDTKLFNKLEDTFSVLEAGGQSQTLHSDLWAAIEIALATVNQRRIPIAILVDGLDEIHGGDAKGLHEKLSQIVGKFASARLITFSKPSSYIAHNSDWLHLEVTIDHIHEDIRTYLRTSLHAFPVWRNLDHAKQADIIQLASSHAKEPFLFAYLISRLVASGVEPNALYKNLKSASFSPLKELAKQVDLKNSTVHRFLAFMIAAQRPLSTGEMKDLLCVDVTGRKTSPHVDVQRLFDLTLGLVTLRNGKLRFRHSSIRTHLIGLCGQTLMSIKEAHRQLATSMLLFTKLKLTRSCELTLDGGDSTFVRETLCSHDIVRYMVRYWTFHVRQSTLVGANNALALTQEFKEIFPGSILLNILEWTSWSEHTTTSAELIEMHEWSLRIRSACFGEKHRSVLQTLIMLGNLHRGHSDVTKACDYFYQASTIGQAILFKFSPIVVSCTNLFLICSETIVFTEQTILVSYREEMIRFMITVCEGQHGPHSDIVIRWYKALAKLYVDIHEEHLAIAIYKKLREIIVIRFGPASDECRHVTEGLAGLEIVLKKQDGCSGSIIEIEDLFFESIESRDYTDELRITILLRLARIYETEGRYFFAERLYISLWRCISEACRLKTSIELRFSQINIALKYVYFLRGLKRTEEATSILICIWAEYEHQHFEEMTIIVRLKELAVLFRSCGLLTTAVCILKRVWLWFKEKKLTEHEEASSTIVVISEVVEEITETTTETTITTTVTETLTREIFETTYTRCKGGKGHDHHFFRACLSLVNLYLKLEKWSEAETTIRKSLELVWKSVLDIEGKIVLEGDFVSERILVATRLAVCFHRQRLFDKAEQFYLRIWRACLTLRAEDMRLIEATTTLVAFYEEYHRHDKVIEVYVEVLRHYRKHLGASHKITISVLYKLAAVYMLLGRGEAYDCYIEIVTINSKDGCCHHDGFEAAAILLHFYHQQKRWVELERLCVLLWETIEHHHEWTYTEDFVQLVWQRYRFILEFHLRVEFSVLYKLTIQYREIARKIFGLTAAIIIEAMLAIAELCEGHEDHYHESITIYEEIITKKKTTTTVTETKIRTVKKRLSKVYVTVITSGKKTETTTVERAIALCLEIYEHSKVELGWYHETTLIKLRELVLLYNVFGEKHRGTILSLLQASVIYVISNAKASKILYDTATILAGIYLQADLQQQGRELLRQLRYLILFPGFDAADQKITIKLEVKVTKVALVFLISFDEGLVVHSKDAVCGFSQIMGDLLMETILYEQYASVITTVTETTGIEIVLEHAGRLRWIWVARGRNGFVDVLDKKLFALFTAQYAKQLGPYAGDKYVFDLYVSILHQIGDGALAERATVDFAQLTCKAINTVVHQLLVEKNDLSGANAIAQCGFQFANSQRFYHRRNCFAYGYRLADLLASDGTTTSWKSADSKQKDALLGTSRAVLQSVLGAMKEAGIDLLSLRFEDISRLIHLLGEQKNYEELEVSSFCLHKPSLPLSLTRANNDVFTQKFLIALWRSREVQRSWSPDTVLHIGSLLVEAHVGASQIEDAIELCDTLYHNLRHSRGGTDPQALYFADRLTTLLGSSGRTRQAARVHEDVLHDLDEHQGASSGGRQGDLRAAADRHLEGVRTCGFAARNGGVSTSRPRSYTDLYARLGKFGKLSVPSPEQWAPTAKGLERQESKTDISVLSSVEWVLTIFTDEKGSRKDKKRDSIQPAKERWGCGWGKNNLGAEIVY